MRTSICSVLEATGEPAPFLLNNPSAYMDVYSTVFPPADLWIHAAASGDGAMALSTV